MNKIAIYSCITGNYESVQPQDFSVGDFFMFTDGEVTGKWNKRKPVSLYTDPRRNARYHKILSHILFPDYDYTIWIDGSIELKEPADLLVQYMGRNELMALKHPDRNCVYDEAIECLRLKLDHKEKIEAHVKRLRDNNYPENNGLTETKSVVRKNTKKIEEFNKEWFYQLSTGSLRDQLSFDYAMRKTKVKIKYMPPIQGNNMFFNYRKHKRSFYA